MKMLRSRRKEKHMTMKQLGSIVGVSEGAISQYETGKRQADFETLLKLGDALDCSVDYLLRGTVPPEDKKEPTPETEDGRTKEFVELFEKLGDTEKNIVIAQLKGILSDSKSDSAHQDSGAGTEQ